ncbi:MAG: (2Fe-2S) ferredoxin domain-containing protein [Anaerolineales bacterium]
MKPYTHHLFICQGSDCKKNSKKLKGALKKCVSCHNREHKDQRVMVSGCKCLGMCKKGPVMIAYPDGVWYEDLDEKTICRILEEHVAEGKPVTNKIIHQMD